MALRAAAPDHLVGTIHFCDDDAYCTNTDGGYNCTCNDGYAGDGFNCTDVDECVEGRVTTVSVKQLLQKFSGESFLHVKISKIV